jgi:site-specific recombinase XerC
VIADAGDVAGLPTSYSSGATGTASAVSTTSGRCRTRLHRKLEAREPTAKQRLEAIRMLFDWLVTGQVVATNPAHSVRGQSMS